ncbi:RNA-processing protein [Candidatus Micrarchaeota archaeon]|nr:RNA-processing protein [Candidatus Micrarchaeota archaeon]
MNDDISELVRIPSERVKVLRGDHNSVKLMIEEKCKVTLEIDNEGDVQINGDATEVFFARDVVKAIGRGFLPNDALRLLNQDYNLHIINLKEEVGSENAISRLKGRVIGEKGKMKIEIESATQSIICIYGNTIGIISKIDTMGYAQEAINMLLTGAPHSAAFAYLAKIRREIFENRLRPGVSAP